MAFQLHEENNGGRSPEPNKPEDNIPSDLNSMNSDAMNSTPASQPVPEPDSTPAVSFLADSRPSQVPQQPMQQPTSCP